MTVEQLDKISAQRLEDVDIDINRDDLRIDVYRSSGAGGQHINKTSSAIRITHLQRQVIRISAGQERARLRFHFPIMGKA